jgi:nucleolar protein 56
MTPLGLIVEGEGGVVDHHEFGESIEESLEKYLKVENGFVDRRTSRFLKKISKGSKLTLSSPTLANIMNRMGFEAELIPPQPTPREKLLLEAEFAKDIEEASELLHETYYLLASLLVKRDLEERDKMVIQEVDALEEYTEMINKMYERLREWYGIHFPELEGKVQSMGVYAKTVSELGNREAFTEKKLSQYGIEGERIDEILEASYRSIGAEMDLGDLLQVREHARFLTASMDRKDALEKRLYEVLNDYAPNLSALAGVRLAGVLISRAGGLRRLAIMPSGTIQLLGAEKALFRSLKSGARPPKHGVIFQHPSVNQSPRWIRGKVARALASKLAIAARLDAYGGIFRGGELREGFHERLEEIARRYPKPPPKVKRKRRRKVG